MSLEKVYFVWVNRDKDAFEWFQSLLSTIEDSIPSSFLEIHVYMTGKLEIDDIQNIVLNSGTGVDPLTELQNKSHYGRPDYKNIFRDVAAGRTEKSDVGVFFCGPGALARVVGDACDEVSEGNVKFTLRKEHF
jgi:hypothetical protein